MKKKGNNEEFIKRIFERSEDPISQLERINSIVPSFFANDENVKLVNSRLDVFGFQINDAYVSEMRNQFMMMGHPSCGSSDGYGSGHPSCGSSVGYGWGYGHPSCGSSNGNGHPSCCSSKNDKGKMLLLVKKNNTTGMNHEIRN